MELTITKQALDELQEYRKDNQQYLALTYDTEGCGCGVNGMPTIKWKKEEGTDYISITCEQLPVLVHYQQKVFFAKNMTLEFNGQTFRLTSPEGVLNPIIPTTVLQ
ncbi:iron-sulfur cluster biosynthesis family protein [Gracilibacillus xinjiangensis]|uniref:Iron-sulfur cluster biosynthesis family protein n=1 Tax=Gracilibacillus xinjiangensis TaxID=1193282 RepID=A0ABV8WWQ3_9BACI